MEKTLLDAIRTALRENEIGDDSPYVLSYARKGESGGSFGQYQGDVHSDQMARETLTAILQAANLDTATMTRIVAAVSQPCPNGSPLDNADQSAADAALCSAKGRTLVDAMDEKIFQRILQQLDPAIRAAQSVHRQLDPGAQISIALWVNMTGPLTTLLDWLEGKPVEGVEQPARTTVTKDDLQRYLANTNYFQENPENLLHFEESVVAGLRALEQISVAASANQQFATKAMTAALSAGTNRSHLPKAVQPTKATEPQDAMLGYFLSTLAVRVMSIKYTVSNDDSVRLELLNEAQTSLNSFAARFPDSPAPANHSAWSEAYRIERVLALIEPASRLVGELKRQTAEAQDERISAASRLVAAFEAALPQAVDTSHSPPELRLGGEEILRPLLLQTLEELHWHSQRKFYARPIQKSATYRIVYLGIGAFVLFLAPYLLIYFEIGVGKEATLASWSGLPLYTALTSGLFGAFFSRLLYLQQNWNALTLGSIMDARDVTSILLRGCVGMTGATMIYFFLQSETMTGALLPKFSEIGFAQHMFPKSAEKPEMQIRLFYPNPALALLVVWCFLAGFSERLVPSILETTEASLGKKDTAK